MLGAAVLIAVDLIIKKLAVDYFKGVGLVPFIDGLLGFYYHENTGAAFGIFQGQTKILAILTAVFIAFSLYVLLYGLMPKSISNFAFMLVIAGGTGNFIDRVTRGFVVDYIYVLPFNFPVFNFADICVVIGVGLLILQELISSFTRNKTEKNIEISGASKDCDTDIEAL